MGDAWGKGLCVGCRELEESYNDRAALRAEVERLRGALEALRPLLRAVSALARNHAPPVVRLMIDAAVDGSHETIDDALSPSTPAAPSSTAPSCETCVEPKCEVCDLWVNMRAKIAAPSSEYRRGYEACREDVVKVVETMSPRVETASMSVRNFVRASEVIAAIRFLLPAPREVTEDEEDPSGRDDPACDAAWAAHCREEEVRHLAEVASSAWEAEASTTEPMREWQQWKAVVRAVLSAKGGGK